MDNIPEGYCQCGCGEFAGLYKNSNPKLGVVEGRPKQFINGHAPRRNAHDNEERIAKYRRQREEAYPSVPYGECQCGCGERTAVYRYTSRSQNILEGQPKLFANGHGPRITVDERRERVGEYRKDWRQSTDTPYGECQCGCGEKTNVARYTSFEESCLAGEPRRFISGHNGRSRGLPYHKDPLTGCWIWKRQHAGHEYGRIYVDGRTRVAHRFIYEQECGPIPDDHHLHHVCVEEGYGSTFCVNPEHLEPLPVLNHMRLRKNLLLNEDKVRHIRQMLAEGMRQPKIAAVYGVSQATISSINVGKIWRDVH